MHFDHFVIRLLDRRTKKLELVISAGLPNDALNIDLYAEADGNGISGYVSATGRSYICPDVERDPRYVIGAGSGQKQSHRSAAPARPGDRHFQYREPATGRVQRR